MVITEEPLEPASRWDFTPVFELLRQPLQIDYREQKSPPKPHVSSASQHKRGKDDDFTLSEDFGTNQRYLTLSDFRSPWDLKSQEEPDHAATLATKPLESPQSKVDDPYSRVSPVTILRRPSRDATPSKSSTKSNSPPALTELSSSVASQGSPDLSPTPPAGIPVIKILRRGISDTAGRDDGSKTTSRIRLNPAVDGGKSLEVPTLKPRSKVKTKSPKANKKNQSVLSESSADADSDSCPVSSGRTKAGVLAFVPPQLGTQDSCQDYEYTPPSSYEDKDSSLKPQTVKGVTINAGGTRILPVTHKNADERRVSLMIKLLKDFSEYAQLVSQVGRLEFPKVSQESRPIHVFVDMSNIMVGFHNAAKASRGVHPTTRIRRLHMSFANLSLIMERGRQATKRVLVGSDRLPSIDEAEKLGYETNILDRVHKLKHATTRLVKNHKPYGQGSQITGPETAGSSDERWVEQGVDEILHLKILESLLDTEKPATIVLASGDAAEAEYSGGFLRMVERALQRGWNVELVSFSQVTGNAYKRKDFRANWATQFRMVELDHYVEELFD